MAELLIGNLNFYGYLYYGATTFSQISLGYFIYDAMRTQESEILLIDVGTHDEVY